MDGKYPLSSFVEMIERMQGTECEKLDEIQRENDKKQQETIERATGGERTDPVAQEETGELENIYGPWEQHLIGIHKRDLYFLRPDGTYDPWSVMRESLFVAARDRLAVFGDHVEYR